MLPKKSVRLLIGTLLAADAGSFAPAALANKMALIKAPFAESENLPIGDISLADFDGSTPIDGTLGAQQVAIDPDTGQQRITIKDPLGGYRWVTSGLTNLPETIYGYVLLKNDLSDWIAIKRFDQPVTLTEVGQEIRVPVAEIDFLLNPAS